MTRVAVFIDYQNVYHGAREVEGDPFVSPGGLKSRTHLPSTAAINSTPLGRRDEYELHARGEQLLSSRPTPSSTRSCPVTAECIMPICSHYGRGILNPSCP